MTEVTLIGENLAREGVEFVFGGCLSRCQSCEIKISCCGLKKNRWYRIVDVRDRTHECKVHEGKVKVVEVNEVPLKTAIHDKSLVEGSMVTLKERKKCSNVDCENYRLCFPIGIEFGGKYHIEKLGDKIECPSGNTLRKVELK